MSLDAQDLERFGRFLEILSIEEIESENANDV